MSVLVLLIHTSAQSCDRRFVKGRAGFVLNTEESVAEGASYLLNPNVQDEKACVSACCQHFRCNLALMEKEEQTQLTNCFLFDCLYRNQFVCSFYRKSGFSSQLAEEVYEEHLRGPGGETGDDDKHPLAIAGPDIVTRAGEEVTLNGIESRDDKNITGYDWTLLSGDQTAVMEKTQFVDQRLVSNLHPGVYRFQLTVTDSAGQTDRTSVTVLVLTQEQAEELSYLHRVVMEIMETEHTYVQDLHSIVESVSEGELRKNIITLSSTSGRWQVLSVEDRQLCYTKDELQDEQEMEKESDDVLMEDFSNSMISCWSFRAKALLQFSMDEDWKAHGDTQLSEREDRPVCTDLNTNQSISKFSRFEQELKTAFDHELLSVDHVSAVEESDQYKEKDIALNQDGHSSEEEVEENCAGRQNHSILPSSVLDKAGVIAEHFISNARRSSVTLDELRSPHRNPQEVTKSKNASANFAPLSPREEMGSGSEQQLGRRRESFLSKKEQLLIDKIRNYYENAEEKDTGFSLKRRESLMYIPSGLVRTSVCHFNKIPHTDYQIKPLNTQTSAMTSSPLSSDISAKSEKTRRLSSTEFDGTARQRSEECFRSSAEMIKVWQEMEKEVTSSLEENTFKDQSQFREKRSVPQRFSRNRENRVEEQPKATEDLNTITEESAVQGEDEKQKNTRDWRKTFSQNLQSREAVNQPRRRVLQTTINTGKSNLMLSLTPSVQTTQNIQSPLGSSIRNGAVLPPEFSHFLESAMPEESFFWPNVRKLCSMYASLECPPLASLMSSENTLSPGCKTNNMVCGIQRAASVNGKLGSLDWINVENRNGDKDYSVSAQAALPNNRNITVLEKVQTRAAPKQSLNEIQPFASQEKTLLPSVSERCRLYEDLDRTKPDSRNNVSKTDKHS
ncbi:Kunitz-type protease inhibitor 1 [Bagarius yarrelli]|uniref:Kunitz-type protease inhibitor 1 n=1 Tax=Bagarius yarrelli TaxID=175774 RepID=A0A556VVY0_BAGYA|nr:Kunitz-type protease inhibitor 1 [Bagarius yarrelli]